MGAPLMPTMQVFDNASSIITLFLTVFGVLSALAIWFDKRQKATALSVVRETSGKSNALAHKVDEIEGEVQHMASDVTLVKEDVAALGKRMNSVERSLETVARQSDVASLNAELKHLSGGVTAELRVLSGLMHSFRESALRATEKGSDA